MAVEMSLWHEKEKETRVYTRRKYWKKLEETDEAAFTFTRITWLGPWKSVFSNLLSTSMADTDNRIIG